MTRPSVVVYDYGSGNLRSAERALARVGAEVTVTADAAAALDADGLVVPGVGAFAACMAGVAAVGGSGARSVLVERAAAARPMLGICVGMQILFHHGDEHGVHTEGVGLFDGGVTRLHADVVPHMGWNTVEAAPGSRLFAGVEDERFYFVHSYAATAAPGAQVTYAEHGERFVAAVERGPLAATQFHPEKSGDAGAHLLANWVGMLL
ncbi:MAG: imidazole glycerol phosphate synthase subunit HisH [Actinomycetota bacterium]|nr:imidazole glycerol phosphate synthase subunit HisH [Actinomycetota bacterium]